MLNVREIQEKDVALIAQYWFESEPEYLTAMGIDLTRMPAKEEFIRMLQSQISLPYRDKKSYALIWESENQPIGHSNLNPVTFGEEAFMHIHIWRPQYRQKGMGKELIKMSLPFYFRNFELQKLNCEPYALNTAPNRTLEKSGFTFVKEYITSPGSITFEQPVKRWEIIRDKIIGI